MRAVVVVAVILVFRFVVGPDHSDVAAIRPADAAASDLPAAVPAVLLAAGDVATCGGAEDDTGALLADLPGVVAPLAYPDGAASEFDECYDPVWGAVWDRTRPTVGSHETRTKDAGGQRR